MNDVNYGIAWQDSFRLGDDRVDSQHFQIFKLLSSLVGSCMDGSATHKIRETLDFLFNYTVRHFQDEETLQIECAFPGYKAHKQLHNDFILEVCEISSKFNKTGLSTELSNDLNKIVANWLINHIMREDKKIGEHLRSHRELAAS